MIADGGADETVPRVLSDTANFPNVDYEYIRYPYDVTYTEYYIKLADALSRVDTPFVAMADNDDFCIVDGLRRSVDFLAAHSDFSACRGMVASGSIKPSGENGELDRIYGEEILFTKSYHNSSITKNTAGERVQLEFLSYSPTFYDVHRTGQLQRCFQTLRHLNPKDIFLAELLTHFLTVAAGKVQRDPYLYLVRQANSPGSSAGTENIKGDAFDRMLRESWSEDFTKFVTTIASAVVGQDQAVEDSVRSLIIRGYRNYAAHNIVRCLSNRNDENDGQKAGGITQAVRKLRFNGKTRRYLRQLKMWYSLGRRILRGELKLRHATFSAISIDGSSEYSEYLKPILDVVTSPPHLTEALNSG